MRTLLFSLLALLLTLPAQAQSPDDVPWTLDHILEQRSLSDVDISPEGDRVLWVKRAPDADADRTRSDLYLTYRDDPHGGDSTATIQLTRTGDNDDPRWSPNGQQIAFLSSRDQDEEEASGTQIWRLDPRGGAPEPVTSVEHGVQGKIGRAHV